MEIQKQIDERVRTALGDMHVQLIIALTNLDAAKDRIKELEAKLESSAA